MKIHLKSFLINNTTFIVWTCAILALVSATIVARYFNFDGIEFNGDSYVYFQNAKVFSSALANAKFPPPLHWPYGYPALLSIAFKIGGVSFKSAQWVNIVAGALLVAVLCETLRFIAELKNLSKSSIFIMVSAAGILPLAHGLFLKYQLDIMSDIMAALWASIALLFCWKWRYQGKSMYVILAGISLGLAIFTRYVYSLLVLPCAVSLIMDTPFNPSTDIKKIIKGVLLLGIFSFISFLPQLVLLQKDTSSTLGNGLLAGWSFHNFLTYTFESVDGHQTAIIPSVLYYFLLPFRWQCFTPFGIIVFAIGLKHAIREIPRWVWFSLIIWYAGFYLLLCGIPEQNSRIGFPLFIPVTIFLALGMLECYIIWRKRFTKILIIGGGLWFISLYFSLKVVVDLIKTKDELKSVAEVVKQLVPENSRIISTSLYAVYLAYPQKIEPISVYQLNVDKIQKLLADKKPSAIVVDEDIFVKKFENYECGKSYRWLKTHYSCKFLCRSGEYYIYQIEQ